MKSIHIKTLIGAAMILLFLVGCEDILEEKPRSIFTPEFFKTEQRCVRGGINVPIRELRQFYGQGYYYNSSLSGTDEACYGQSADNNSVVACHMVGRRMLLASSQAIPMYCGSRGLP